MWKISHRIEKDVCLPHITDKVLMSRICTELVQIMKVNIHNPIKNKQEMNKKCTKENVHMPSKHIRKYVQSHLK